MRRYIHVNQMKNYLWMAIIPIHAFSITRTFVKALFLSWARNRLMRRYIHVNKMKNYLWMAIVPIHANSACFCQVHSHIMHSAMRISSKQFLTLKLFPPVPLDISLLFKACYIPCPSCSLWFCDPNNSHLHFPSSFENICKNQKHDYFSWCQVVGPSPNSHAGVRPYLLSANASSPYMHLPSLSRMWDLCWTKCHRLRFVSEYFGFFLSVSFHQW